MVTGALVLARLHPTNNLGMTGVLFTGLVDNGCDAQDVMVDIDHDNTWWPLLPRFRSGSRPRHSARGSSAGFAGIPTATGRISYVAVAAAMMDLLSSPDP